MNCAEVENQVLWTTKFSIVQECDLFVRSRDMLIALSHLTDVPGEANPKQKEFLGFRLLAFAH